MNEKTAVYEPLERLQQWVEQANWTAYDTFDGLSSPYARIFTFGSGFLKQVWQQSVRRFPINLRPLLGIKPSMSRAGLSEQGQVLPPMARGQSVPPVPRARLGQSLRLSIPWWCYSQRNPYDCMDRFNRACVP
jgi:hypothetical protein